MVFSIVVSIPHPMNDADDDDDDWPASLQGQPRTRAGGAAQNAEATAAEICIFLYNPLSRVGGVLLIMMETPPPRHRRRPQPSDWLQHYGNATKYQWRRRRHRLHPTTTTPPPPTEHQENHQEEKDSPAAEILTRPLGLVESSFDHDGRCFEGRADMNSSYPPLLPLPRILMCPVSLFVGDSSSRGRR